MAAVTGAVDRDVGLGTAYERWAIQRRIHRWCTTTPDTALEGPIDGFAGIAGLHLVPLARRGTRVTVVSATRADANQVEAVYEALGLSDRLESLVGDRPPNRRFELAVSFNALLDSADWRTYLERQLGAARELHLYVTNPDSWGALLCRGRDRMLGGRGPRLYSHEAARAENVEPLLRSRGRILDRAWVDAPWWPDLFVETGETLLTGIVGRAAAGRRRGELPHTYPATAWPWSGAGMPREVRAALRRHPTFERAPRAVSRLFAHHHAWRVALG